MTDVSAQAFREAAASFKHDWHAQQLLLAAAEQREALDTLTAERDLLTKVNARVTDLLAIVKAERDEAKAKVDKVLALLRSHCDYAPVNVELAMAILDAPTRPA